MKHENPLTTILNSILTREEINKLSCSKSINAIKIHKLINQKILKQNQSELMPKTAAGTERLITTCKHANHNTNKRSDQQTFLRAANQASTQIRYILLTKQIKSKWHTNTT
jgi:hypothetical protein